MHKIVPRLKLPKHFTVLLVETRGKEPKVRLLPEGQIAPSRPRVVPQSQHCGFLVGT